MAGKIGRPPLSRSIEEYYSTGSGRKLWREGKVQAEMAGQGPSFDDGKYLVKIVSAKVTQSKNGRWQHVTGFKFVEGDYKGQTVYQYQGIDNEVGLGILFKQLELLGVEVESPEDFKSADKKLESKQPTVEIRLVTKGEFQNVYVTKVEESDGDNDKEEEESDNDDDDDKEEKEVEESDEKDDVDTSDDDSDDDDDDDDKEEEDEEEEKDEKPAKKSSKKDEEDEEEKDEDEDEDEDDDDKDEEDEKEEEEENVEKVTLAVGMKLKVKNGKEEVTGKIVKILEEKSQVKVKLKDGSKIYVNVDDIVDVVG